MYKYRLLSVILVIVIFNLKEVLNVQVYSIHNLTSFANARKLYPISNVGEGDTTKWNLAPNDDLNKHPCKRQCIANQRMTCYYNMLAHHDETLSSSCAHYTNPKNIYTHGNRKYINPNILQGTGEDDECKYADGVRTEVMVVNGRLPGPVIEVCFGDTIVTDIVNGMNETTTIHWHGIHQGVAPYMDGVPNVSQFPLEPGKSFRYRFQVDHAGTHWWHSHVNHQRAFGFAGAMVVRETSEKNVHAKLYDYDNTEHIIVLQDWMKDLNETNPTNIIINGLGRNINDMTKPILYSRFPVGRGGRYRFRLVFNGVINCPVSFSIDQHDLLLIASDGNDIEPIKVQKIILHSGERFDFVLKANRKVDNYWIRVKGYTNCARGQLHQEAILHYISADRLAMPKGPEPSYMYEPPNATEFNGLNVSTTPNPKMLGFNDAKALKLQDKPTKKPDITLYTSMSIISRNNSNQFQIDNITFAFPHTSYSPTDKQFCNRTQLLASGIDCTKQHCNCTNILQVPAFKHIELVVSGKPDTVHPIHLHGYTFRVVGMGVLGRDKIDMIEKIDRQKPLPRRLSKAPLKDTIQVPAYGYTILRFYANNPGYWFLHCHISTHAENGMSAVVRVGEDSQMKDCPNRKCGLYNPKS